MMRLLSVFGLALALVLSGCGDDRPRFASTDITGATFAQGFALTDHLGQPRTLKDFQGKVVVVFFGFTQCPDVCPTTLTTLSRVLTLLGEDAKRVQGLFVTLDPARDTPAVLASYVPQFHPSFIGLYADTSATQAVARDFKVFFQKNGEGGHYTLDHTTGSYIFDPQGRVRLFTQHSATAETLAADIRQLLAGK